MREIGKLATPKDIPHTNATQRGTYSGDELKPFSGRPGAMDAFSLPSVRNGTATPRQRPGTHCTGGVVSGPLVAGHARRFT
jgi:hypothetical protein